MKLRLAALAGMLLAASMAARADETPAAAAFAEALIKASKERQAAFGDLRDTIKVLDAQAKFEYSPALQEQLLTIFGSTNPLRLVRTAVTKSQIQYGSTLKPFTYRAQDGSTLSAGEAMVKVAADKRGRKLKINGALPSFSFLNDGEGVIADDLRVNADLVKEVDQLWYGLIQLQAASVVLRGQLKASGQVTVNGEQVAKAAVNTPDGETHTWRMDGMALKMALRRHGKLADIGYDFGMKSFTASPVQLDRVHLAMRLQNMDAAIFKTLQKDAERVDVASLSQQQQAEMGINQMKRFAAAMLKPGAAIVLDDFSASYHGATASMKGRISFDKLKAGELTNAEAWKNKIVVQFDVRVPLAMVRDVSRTVAMQQMKAAANGAEPDPAAVEKSAGDLAAVFIGQAVGKGFGLVADDQLRTTIRYRNGELTLNGKEFIQVPPAGPPVMPVEVPEASPAPASQ